MIRRAREEDIPALTEIYNDAILHTTATFDIEVKSLEDRRGWFAEHCGAYVIFVAEENGTAVGYASLSRYQERKAFERSAELSVYVHRDWRGRGIGGALVTETLAFAEARQELGMVISQVTADNEASVRLHRQLGFSCCGQIKKVGEKFGRLLDLNIYQKDCTKTESSDKG